MSATARLATAVRRLADPQTGALYPAPVEGPSAWRRDDAGWRAELELGAMPAGTILAPSLSILQEADYRFRFTLHAGSHSWPLPAVPAAPAAPVAQSSVARDAATAAEAVQSRIDCWHSVRDIEDARLEVTSSAEPVRYLLAATLRPVELESLPAAPRSVIAPRPPERSQMLENPRIANRICSPVSLAMVLAQHHPERAAMHEIIRGCRDPLTGMYGVWPLAIQVASRTGSLGAVELLSDWTLVEECLARSLPVVASIRYAGGALPGSPQRASGGHLVVVYGIAGDHVLVNDPAATVHGSVARRYPLEAFAEAWFRHRGAAYILLP